MGFLNTNSMPRLVEKLADGDNIKITGNSKGNRVGTVIKKIVEKADDVTKAIEQEVVNDSYSFKVGTGNVDVSTDVEDGFGEVGVKGVTYQNLIPNLIDSRWKVRGSAITDRTDLVNGVKLVITSEGSCVLDLIDISMFKPNTKYTLLVNIDTNFIDIRLSNILSSLVKLENGFNCVTFLTKSDFNEMHTCFRIGYTGSLSTGLYMTIKDLIVLEGDHTNNPNLPSYFEDIVGVGDKSKNLFNPNLVKQTVLNNLGSLNATVVEQPHRERCSLRGVKCKPNTTYTIKAESNINISLGSISDAGTSLGETGWKNAKSGIVYTTPNNAKELAMNISKANNSDLLDVEFVNSTNLQLEEGSTATPYEPYYDGHKIEILSHGKNLYKPNLQIKSANGLTFSLHGNTLIVNGTCTKIVDFRPINGTESITLELYNYVNKLPVGTTLKLSNNLGLKNFFSLKRNGAQTYPANTLIVQEGDYGISCFVRFEEGQSYNNAELKIQLEINNVATEFEPYIEDKTQILLDEPLMRLPKGVCDEITRDGKLIRRVGKVVFDGTENWTRFETHFEDFDEFSGNTGNHTILQSNSIVNNFPQTNNRRVVTAGNTTYIRLPKGIVNSLNECKQWLSQNPTTVYYELSTPVITELPAPYLRIFKDGHLTFNTLVAPESNHVVQLNKSAQIERSIREVQGLDSRVGQLESFYDDMMLETNHKLSLLNYDFEYTRERKGE